MKGVYGFGCSAGAGPPCGQSVERKAGQQWGSAQLSPAVDKLAQAEALPDGDPQRVVLTKFASDDIANYEQTEVVQQRIYNPSWQVRSVFQANQWLSKRPWGRDMGATAPEVALSSDCNATDRIPFTGNIGNATDRVQYYKDLMSSFGKLKPQAAEGLMTNLKAFPHARVVILKQYAGVVTAITISGSVQKVFITEIYRELTGAVSELHEAGWQARYPVPTLERIDAELSKSNGTTTAIGLRTSA